MKEWEISRCPKLELEVSSEIKDRIQIGKLVKSKSTIPCVYSLARAAPLETILDLEMLPFRGSQVGQFLAPSTSDPI